MMLVSWQASSAPLREKETIIRFQSYNQNQIQHMLSILIDDNQNAPLELHLGSDADNKIIIFNPIKPMPFA